MGTNFYNAQQLALLRVFALAGRLTTITVVLLLVFFSGYSQTTNLSFTQLTGDFMAPGRGAQNWGMHPWNDITQPTIPSGNSVAKNYYTRFNWLDIESNTAQGSYNWSNFDNFVNQAIDAGAMFSFGIMPLCDGCGAGGAIPQYVVNLMSAEGKPGPNLGGVIYPNYQSTNWKNRYCALMRAVANHISSTSRNGHPYSSAFLAYDLRHAGNFGEFADLYDNSSYGSGAQVTDAYLNAMVDSAIAIYPNVQLTIPMGYFTQNGNLYGNTSGAPGQASAYHVLTASNNYGRIGWRRDNIGDDGYNVYFTGNTGSYNPGTGVVQFQPLIMNMWQYAPIGGEPSSSQGGVSRCGTIYCDLHNENTLFHYSYFGNGNAPGGVSNSSGATWTQLQTNWRSGSAEQGYKLILTGGSMTTTLSSGSPFNITLNWQNTGLAPVYEKWNVTYELRNSSGTAVWTGNSSFSPRLFLPQSSATPVSDNLTLSSVASGTYSMFLIIRDPLNYKAPLPLAVSGRNADGSYLLRSNITVGSGGPVNQPPTANAGSDKTIQLPTSLASLTGTGTDPDGTISSYAWTKVSGPASGVITTPATATTTVTSLIQGVYKYVLTVTDNLGAKGTDTVQVTVNTALAANLPPVANAGTDQTITLPTSSVTINGSSSSDPDGSISSYLWTKISGPTQWVIGNNGAASTLVSNLTAGSYSFQLKVTDNGGATALDTVKVTVNPAPVNQPPVAKAGADQNITLPTNSVTLNGSASSDPDGSISSYLWTIISGPAQYTLGNNTTASTLLSNLTAGSYSFQLKVTDNGGATALDTIKITVNPAPVNQPPVAKAGADQNITLPTNSVTLNGSASSDPDGSISAYLWTKISGPTQYTLGNNASASTLLSNLVAGVYSFQLKVTDNGGAIALDTIKVNVAAAPVNQPPVANAGADISITLPTNVATLNGSGSTDPDGTISTYSWRQVSGPSTATISTSTAASTGLTGLQQGTYTFSLKVTDNSGATDLDSVRVIVNPAPNQPPVANAGSSKTITLPLNSVSLDGSLSSDPDGSISSYAWTQVSGPATSTITGASTSTATATGLVAGLYTFKLTVTDNTGATASATVKITVASPAPQPPTANAGADQTITLPVNSITIDGSSSSASSGSIVSYAWTEKSGPSTIGLSNTAINTLNNLQAGVYVFSLTVTDNNGATGTDQVTITVNAAANQPPVANAGTSRTITLPLNSVSLNGSLSSDPDGSISSFAWTQVSGPATSTISGASTSTATATGLVAGLYTFKLTVTDNKGATASATVKVTVASAALQPPVANAGADQTITLPINSVTIDGSGSSASSGSIVSYVWTEKSGPNTVGLSNTAKNTVNNLQAGVYVFSLTITDNNGATGTDQVTITVNPAPNQPPVANAGSGKTITLPVNSVSLDGSLSSDPDGSISSYAWTQVSGPATSTITGASTSTATATGLVAGLYTFRLTVTDNTGASASATVKVTVIASLQPPVANAGANQTITLPSNSVTIDGSASSASSGSIVSYAWNEKSGPSTVSLTNSVTNTVNNLVAGVYVFTLTVTDNNANSDTDSVTITVNVARNQKPVANAGSNKNLTLPKKKSTLGTSTTMVDSTASTTLDGSTSYDPDGSVAGYRWTQISGPSSSTLSGSNTAVATVSDLIVGQYVFQLTVVDNSGDSSSAQVKVIVSPAANIVPVANAGPNQSITAPANTVTLDGSASDDPDGSITKYSWVTISGPGSVTISNSNTAAPTTTGLTTGVYIFELTVTDNSGATASDQVTVIVNPKPVLPNEAPVANAGTNQTITAPTNSVDLNGTSSFDPDGTIAKYAWTQVSGPGSSLITAGNTATPSASELVVGQYVYQLTVTDNNGATNTDQVTITVNAGVSKVDIPPVANAGLNDTISLPVDTYTLNAGASYDQDGTVDTYQWKQTSGPNTATTTSMSNAQVNLSGLAAGEYEFEVTVTDNDGVSSVASVHLTVEPGTTVTDKLVVFPNPAHQTITGKVTSTVNGTVKIYVYDVNGKLVAVTEAEKYSEVLYKSFDISGLAPGMYTARIIIANRKTMVTKFIKY